MSQQLANVVVKTNQFGSTVVVKHVTPAELMFIVADNHSQAGGDPILKLEEVSPDSEAKLLKQLHKELEALQESRSALDLESNLTSEVREQRERRLIAKQQVIQDQIVKVNSIQTLRTLSPSAERRRLGLKYNSVRIAKFFGGSVPTLPQTFDEAKANGLELIAPSERLLTVGDNPN